MSTAAAIARHFTESGRPCGAVDVSDGHLWLEDGASRRRLSRLGFVPQSAFVLLLAYDSHRGKSNLSLYARGRDYHAYCADVLTAEAAALEAETGFHFAAFSDTSPLNERKAAIEAGLGFPGKNGLLINETCGSFVFIASLLSDLAFSEDARAVCKRTACIGCGQCLRCCPGGALSADGIDISRCLSAITQKKGLLSPEEEALMRKAGTAWGCDVCQTVCPHNYRLPDGLAWFREDCIDALTPEIVENLGQYSTRAFAWRGKAVLRRNLEILGGKDGDA